MPIPASMLGPMLDPFRNMMKELDQKGLSGPEVEQCRKMLAEMEREAAATSDIAGYSMKMAQQGYFMNFGTHYGKALQHAAAAKAGSAQPDDGQLLADTVAAYAQSLSQLEAEPTQKHLVGPMRKLVALGRSGVSYPVFLRQAEEQELFEAVKNGEPRATIEFDLEAAKTMVDPLRVEMQSKLLAVAQQTRDPLMLELDRFKLEVEYEPRLRKWAETVWLWTKCLYLVQDWLDSFCAFAPFDQRWRTPGASEAQVKENILETQGCNPWYLAVREAQLREVAGIGWDGIFGHETYLNEAKAGRLPLTDEIVGLCRKVRPLMTPDGRPPKEAIAQEEDVYKHKRFRTEAMDARARQGYALKPFSEFAARYGPK